MQEALDAGYKVRGTTRSEERAKYTEKVFKNSPNYSTAIVPDFSLPGAYDEALKDVDAVIHMASDVSFSPDPNVVVKDTESATLQILRSAAKVPSVKRFVLTSSSAAVLFPGPDVTVDEGSWNEEALKLAWAPPPYTMERAFPVYAASKVAGEKAFWKFFEDEKPNFVGTTILPNMNLGRILTAGGPTGKGIEDILGGTIPDFPPRKFSCDPSHIKAIDRKFTPSITAVCR